LLPGPLVGRSPGVAREMEAGACQDLGYESSPAFPLGRSDPKDAISSACEALTMPRDQGLCLCQVGKGAKKAGRVGRPRQSVH